MHIRAFHLFISRLCASVELEISIGLRHCQVIVNKSYSNATPGVLPVTHRVSHSFFIPGRFVDSAFIPAHHASYCLPVKYRHIEKCLKHALLNHAPLKRNHRENVMGSFTEKRGY